jgi:hypothetical protein
MRLRLLAYVGLAGLLSAAPAWSQELAFRSVPRLPVSSSDDIVTLGRPILTTPTPATSFITPVSTGIVRGQIPDGPPPMNVPPPPFAPGGAPPVFPGGGPVGGPVRPNEEAYNCGRINDDADTGGFFDRWGDRFRRCWTDVSDGVKGGFSGSGSRAMFQSDTENCWLISPVSNPHQFEDPRALTEFRPVFMWQSTPGPSSNFGGGSNYFLTLQGRVALTENISIVLNRLGWVWTDVRNSGPDLVSGDGFSEIHIGPKFTFLRSCDSRTVAAIGANFELPVGSSRVAQDTGDFALSPYFSFAQGFGRTSYGGFNFINTTGYSFAFDSQRTDQFYSSFHLDYDLLDQHKFYPLIEMNWHYYPFNGGARNLGFEGADLFNFGSTHVAGRHDLTLAVGARYKFSEAVQVGVTGEFSLLGDGSHHLDAFRLTMDLILRY